MRGEQLFKWRDEEFLAREAGTIRLFVERSGERWPHELDGGAKLYGAK